MNVNKKNAGKRIRRTPEEARQHILDVAANRLAEHGLEGLNIAELAAEAGISHASVIHHFGSSGAMRGALMQRLTHDLLEDIRHAMAQDTDPGAVLERLFASLSKGQHGLLFAWTAVDQRIEQSVNEDISAGLFQEIISAMASKFGDDQEARMRVYLVALAAMGFSIGGSQVSQVVGLAEAERAGFPAWLADLFERTAEDRQ